MDDESEDAPPIYVRICSAVHEIPVTLWALMNRTGLVVEQGEDKWAVQFGARVVVVAKDHLCVVRKP